jgi:F0F1-type ATP synthase membrane subunit b/b'
MSTADLTDPVFIAKIIDFIVFAIAIVYIFQKFLKPQLVTVQEAQNKAVADADAYRQRCTAAVEAAKRALEQAAADAQRMETTAEAHAKRVVADELAQAEEHATRIVAHAAGELERERFRVRRELLEETVDRAHAEAREDVRRELTPGRQQRLVELMLSDLERNHA